MLTHVHKRLVHFGVGTWEKGVEIALEKEEERASDQPLDCTGQGPTADPKGATERGKRRTARPGALD